MEDERPYWLEDWLGALLLVILDANILLEALMNGKSGYRRFIKPDKVGPRCKENKHHKCFSLRCKCNCHIRKSK